jgi:class 3 adenylate cyclase/cbb3-type cytochrome oxidase subunit 3
MRIEERTLAIVLLDIIGSTAFVQRVGDAKAAMVFQVHDRMVRDLITRFNGQEIDRSDGFLLYFESIQDAVNFGLLYQLTVPDRTKLQGRVGIHWSSIVVVHQDYKYIQVGAKRMELEGIGKNIAARAMSLCGRGQILLTKDAMDEFKKKGANSYTPKSSKYSFIGAYKFKGLKKYLGLYAMGFDKDSLRIPEDSEKAKRMGGFDVLNMNEKDVAFYNYLIQFVGWVFIFSFTLFFLLIIYLILDPVLREQFLTAIDIIIKEFK